MSSDMSLAYIIPLYKQSAELSQQPQCRRSEDASAEGLEEGLPLAQRLLDFDIFDDLPVAYEMGLLLSDNLRQLAFHRKEGILSVSQAVMQLPIFDKCIGLGQQRLEVRGVRVRKDSRTLTRRDRHEDDAVLVYGALDGFHAYTVTLEVLRDLLSGAGAQKECGSYDRQCSHAVNS